MAKKTLAVEIQYQVKVADGSDSKTYEYKHGGYIKADRAEVEDPFLREINLLKFLVKEFKDHASGLSKSLEKQAKQARKAAKASG